MAKKESPEQQLANVQAAQLAAQIANWAAQLEFQKERMRLLEIPQFQHASQIEIDRLAFQKAEAAYARALSEATHTGTYQGQPTIAWLTQQAQLTGVLNGQQTLQGKLTDAQVAQMNHAMTLESRNYELEREKFGYSKQRDTQLLEYQKQKDARDLAIQEGNLTGYFGNNPTLAREQMALNAQTERARIAEQRRSTDLSLLAGLQGAGNAFKQARVLGAMQGLTNAWTGKNDLANSPTVTGDPGQAQLSDLVTPYDPWTGLPMPRPYQPPTQPGVPPPPAPPIIPPTQPAPQEPISVDPVQPFPITGPGYPTPPTEQPFPIQSPYFPDNPTVGTPYFPDNPTVGTPYQQAPTYGGSGYGTNPDTGEMMLGISGGASTSAMSIPLSTYQGPQMSIPQSSYQPTGYTVSPPGTYAPTQAYNYQPTPSGQTQVYPPGVAAPVTQTQYSTQTPMAPAQQQGLLPSQINAKNYNNTPDYMKDLGWAEFENRGWDPGLAKDLYQRSLPKYGGPKTGTVRKVA